MDVVDRAEIGIALAVKFAGVFDFEVFQNLVFYTVNQNTAEPTGIGFIGLRIPIDFLPPAVFQDGFVTACTFNAFDVREVLLRDFDLEWQFVNAFFQFHHCAVFFSFFQLHQKLDGITEFPRHADSRVIEIATRHFQLFLNGFDLLGHDCHALFVVGIADQIHAHGCLTPRYFLSSFKKFSLTPSCLLSWCVYGLPK